jgi:LmbE family N-acetylglucosaminyl deacetylase
VGEENLLLLAAHPGDEVLACGGLIAEGCRLGRPPFVVILTDDGHEQRSRAALRWLRLPPDRLLHAGLAPDTIPADGPFFRSIVAVLVTLSWRVDCNMVCAPGASGDGGGGQDGVGAIARTLCDAARLPRLIQNAPPDDALTLDVAAHLSVKQAALAAYGRDPTSATTAEFFGRGRGRERRNG